MGPCRQACLFAGAGWLWLFVGVANAQPSSGLDVRFHGPAPCPSAEWVRSEIGRLLGRDASALAGTDARIDARVTPTSAGQFKLTLRTHVEGREGRRTLNAETCEALAAATALIAALAIDPDATRAAHPEVVSAGVANAPDHSREAGPEPTTGSAEASPRDEAQDEGQPAQRTSAPTDGANEGDAPRAQNVDAPDTARTTTRIGWQIGVSASLDIGSLPSAALGATLEAALTLARLELWLSARLWPNNGLDVTAVGGEAANLNLFSAGLSACYRAFDRGVELAPCLGAQYGPMWGRGGSGLDASAGSASWFAFDAALRARWFVLSFMAFQALAGVALPVVRPVFTIEGLATVHEVGPVAGRLEFGLLFRPASRHTTP